MSLRWRWWALWWALAAWMPTWAADTADTCVPRVLAVQAARSDDGARPVQGWEPVKLPKFSLPTRKMPVNRTRTGIHSTSTMQVVWTTSTGQTPTSSTCLKTTMISVISISIQKLQHQRAETHIIHFNMVLTILPVHPKAINMLLPIHQT